jgi:hypothetical protein
MAAGQAAATAATVSAMPMIWRKSEHACCIGNNATAQSASQDAGKPSFEQPLFTLQQAAST